MSELEQPNVSSYMSGPSPEGTEDFVMQQTMIRVKDPKKSLDFYCNVLGFKLIYYKEVSRDTDVVQQYRFAIVLYKYMHILLYFAIKVMLCKYMHIHTISYIFMTFVTLMLLLLTVTSS